MSSAETKTNIQSNVYHITSETEFNEIISRAVTDNVTVFVKFGAVWCGPCKSIQPYYELLASIHKTSIFLNIDINKVTGIADSYNVSSLPTFLVFKDSKYAELMKGANQKRLKELIENQLTV